MRGNVRKATVKYVLTQGCQMDSTTFSDIPKYRIISVVFVWFKHAESKNSSASRDLGKICFTIAA